MAVETYRIQYKTLDDLEFKSRASVEKYLKEEEAVWEGVLSKCREFSQHNPDYSGERHLNASVLSQNFEDYLREIDDPDSFNVTAELKTLAPPSTSLPGQLILGLENEGSTRNVVAALCAFLSGERHRYSSEWNELNKLGSELISGAYSAQVLTFHKVSSQEISASIRAAQAHIEALSVKIGEMNQLRIDAEARLAEQEAEAALKCKAHDTEQEALKQKFLVQMQYRAPVELWSNRKADHDTSAVNALWRFFGFAGTAILIALLVPFFAGDYIAASFYQIQGTEQVFSVKGPLTIAGLLLVMSLMLWGIRLQYRVYLSERHLALDAGEKKAFAQTFLALREDKSVGADNEAIVLASLFRPTQDGIIRDDEASLDISAAALLAKQLGSRN